MPERTKQVNLRVTRLWNIAEIPNVIAMVPRLALIQGGFTKLTEQFLLKQPGIVDADVWYADGQLNADVTLSDDSDWNVRTLRQACAREIGLEHTPSNVQILLARSRTRAA